MPLLGVNIFFESSRKDAVQFSNNIKKNESKNNACLPVVVPGTQFQRGTKSHISLMMHYDVVLMKNSYRRRCLGNYFF